jgi:hypothetical protein
VSFLAGLGDGFGDSLRPDRNALETISQTAVRIEPRMPNPIGKTMKKVNSAMTMFRIIVVLMFG